MCQCPPWHGSPQLSWTWVPTQDKRQIPMTRDRDWTLPIGFVHSSVQPSYPCYFWKRNQHHQVMSLLKGSNIKSTNEDFHSHIFQNLTSLSDHNWSIPDIKCLLEDHAHTIPLLLRSKPKWPNTDIHSSVLCVGKKTLKLVDLNIKSCNWI